jgi:mono/diheme cytochrome c family protein
MLVIIPILVLLAAQPLLAADTPRERSGAVLYARYCASCHGPTGRGEGEDAPFFQPQPTDLRSGILDKYSTAELARRVRTGAPLTIGVDLVALRRQAERVEELVAHMKRLPTTNWHIVNDGWDLYVERCQTCHGSTGEPGTLPPGVKTPRSLGDPALQKSMNDDELVAAVRHGRRGMPALTPRVSIDQGRQIAAFVRLLSPGFALYTRYCANCHADDGRGAQSLGEVLGEELALPATVFDGSFFAHRSPEQLRISVWHMLSTHQPQMPHFRYLLSQQQMESIIHQLQATERKKTK